MKTDVLIIGGGAAGLMCAVALKKQNPACSVAVLEKNQRVGKKILATGNGRCNLGNACACPANYHSVAGVGADFAAPALAAFPPENNEAFWRELGLLVITDEAGRQYPYTNQAASVLDILRLNLTALGVKVLTEVQVLGIKKKKAFAVKTSAGDFFADAVVWAAGGLASPQISNADGVYNFLSALGHGSSSLFPALTQIKTAGSLPKALKGLRIPCRITLRTAGVSEQSETGELLFADYGVSGIPAFQLSRRVAANFSCPKPQNQQIIIDTLPHLPKGEILQILQKRRAAYDLPLENFLCGIVNKKLGQQVLKMCGAAPLSRSCRTLTKEEIVSLAELLKGLSLTVTGTTGWKNAQVTAGGLLTADFDSRTMQSKLIEGLFAAGEILDIDGDCGGFNLTWAWSSGRLAARSAAEFLAESKKNAQ